MRPKKPKINAETLEGLEEQLIKIVRTTKVVKGGRRFRFGALMVVGNKKGVVGLGYGKANEIPEAIRKAVEEAKKNLVEINLKGKTIPHEIKEKFCSSVVWMKPATEGTGIIAGMNIRAVLEFSGVENILTKSYGARNTINSSKAALKCLSELVDVKDLAHDRGLAIKEVFN
ncbi:MAG: 30S ribosomal protein S5 [Spirochaetia bacterium]|nr:30S ribosomal protein S5 [Spirochaetia bacterium]